MHNPFTKLFLSAVALLMLVAAHPTPIETSVTPLQQMFILKELKPDVERIGILWNKKSANREALLPQINRASASTEVQVFIASVSDLKDVAPMFRNLLRDKDIQAVWIVENDGIVDSSVGRRFLIKNAAQHGLPLLAPSDDWVNEGAPVSFKKVDGSVQLVVNKAAAQAVSLTIPDKYTDRTQYLAHN